MAETTSTSKTYTCSYCDITLKNRKDYFKHTRTDKHKAKYAYSKNRILLDKATIVCNHSTFSKKKILGKSTGTQLLNYEKKYKNILEKQIK